MKHQVLSTLEVYNFFLVEISFISIQEMMNIGNFYTS